MGLGIAYVAANVSRLPVTLMDINKEQTDKGLKFMGKLIIEEYIKHVKKNKEEKREHGYERKKLLNCYPTLNYIIYRPSPRKGCSKGKNHCRTCQDHPRTRYCHKLVVSFI